MPGRESKRDLLRRAAYDCFREQGYTATSVDKICRAAGVSKGSFYWTYSSKQEIFVDILRVWTDEATEQVHGQFDAATASTDYVGAIKTALGRELKRGRQIGPIWIEFASPAPREPEVRAALSSFYARIRHALTDVLRPILGHVLPPQRLEAVSAAVFSTFTGLVMQEMADPDTDAGELLNDFMNALGMLIDAAQRMENPAHNAPSLQES